MHIPDGSSHPSEPTADFEATSNSSESGWGALLAGVNGVRSLSLAGGVALHAINVYIGTTILPSVVHDIGGLDLYAWNTTIFVIASILGSALSAGLLQWAGPRSAFVLSSLIFAIGAAVCALAPSMPAMLVGRFIQGFGGGFLFALAYAMIRIVFDEPLWPRAMALVSGMWGVATLIGPAIGGFFAELGIWRAAFWSVVLIAILFAILAAVALPGRANVSPRRSSVPLAQLVLLTASVLAVSVGSTFTELMRNASGIAAALALSVILAAVETRSENRLLPRDAFRPASAIAWLYITMALLVLTVTSGEVFMPLFLQVLHRQSALAAGYIAAFMAAGWTLGSIFSSAATGQGIERSIASGPVLGLAGMIGLFLLVPRTSGGTWLDLAPICMSLILIGLGVGISWPHLLTRVLKAASPEEQDLAGASITTIQLFATAIGAALAGMVSNAGGLIEPGGLAGTANAARWLFGTFSFASLLGLAGARRTGKK